MVKASDLEWGFKGAQLEAPAIWGCRAILDDAGRRPSLDVVWDRQGAIGEESARDALLRALNQGGGLDALRRWVSKGGTWDLLDGRSTSPLVMLGIAFHVRPFGGYLYVAAALEAPRG